MKQLLASLFFLGILTLNAQNTSVGYNEKLIFTASYNMSGILTDLAQVTMETNKVSTSKATLLHLKCKARTYSKWDNFFKIDDIYESYVNLNSLAPYLYKRQINEGSYFKYMKYTFNHKSNTVSSNMRKRRRDGTFWEVNKSYSFNAHTKDIVTAIYTMRNIDFKDLPSGSTITLSVLFDNEIEKITLKYLGKEKINTEIGNKECYKLSILLNSKDLLKGNNSNILYLTADANKIPVFAKFKVAVGNGELKIKSATGLKH